MTGELPVTVTVSATVASGICRSSGTAAPTRTVTFSRITVFEALQLEPDAVDSGLQRREAVGAGAIGDTAGRPRHQHRARQGHGHTGHCGALVIGHAQQYRSGLHLCNRRCVARQGEESRQCGSA